MHQSRNTLRVFLFAIVLVGCGDDGRNQAIDAGDDVVDIDAAPPDADTTPQPSVARGQYLVDHVAGCGDCHTPRLENGAPDPARYLAGIQCFVDVNGPDAGGCLHSRNLTDHATGLANRSDAEIKAMIQDGVRPDGEALFPMMPHWLYANFTELDADSIVLYLRTVTGVDHTVPANDPPFTPPAQAAPPLDMATVPDGTSGNANGKYLAGFSCVECHTPLTDPNNPRSLDTTKFFAGNRAFPAAAFGLPVPPFPDVIYTMNLTPHATGLETYTAADIVEVLLQGTDPAGDGVCPPMPSGPMGPFGGLTAQDAADIAAYIDGLAPIDNAIPNGCALPTN